MQPQGGSIWGNINLCVEIALNIYYIVGDKGEGIAIPKEHAGDNFSHKTVAAGRELEGCLYYPKGETMDMPLYEMMQKEYNAVVPEEEQIPQVSVPENLFLQEQLDRARTVEEPAGEEILAEEADGDDYGEQVDYGFEI